MPTTLQPSGGPCKPYTLHLQCREERERERERDRKRIEREREIERKRERASEREREEGRERERETWRSAFARLAGLSQHRASVHHNIRGQQGLRF